MVVVVVVLARYMIVVVPVQHTASALQMLVAAHVSIVECHVPPCPSQLYCVRTVQVFSMQHAACWGGGHSWATVLPPASV